MSFEPKIIYRSPGNVVRPGGGTYKYVGVNSQEDLDRMLEDGWHLTSAEAVKAAGDKANGPKKVSRFAKPARKKKPAKPFGWQQKVKTKAEIPVENEPPTRQELEQKAKELGIKYDGRTGDKKLGQLIADKLGA
jgi:hypothetical protein